MFFSPNSCDSTLNTKDSNKIFLIATLTIAIITVNVVNGQELRAESLAKSKLSAVSPKLSSLVEGTIVTDADTQAVLLTQRLELDRITVVELLIANSNSWRSHISWHSPFKAIRICKCASSIEPGWRCIHAGRRWIWIAS